MVRIQRDGTVKLAIELDPQPFRRQDAPALYDITTIAYSANPRYILETENLFSGNIHASLVERERAIDIDTQVDFDFAEFLHMRTI